MQFDEQRDHVADEQILRVIFLDPERSSPVRLIIRKIKISDRKNSNINVK